MPNARAIAMRDACGIAFLFSMMFLFMLWIELGRGIGWLDVILAVGFGSLATLIIATLRQFKTMIRVPLGGIRAFSFFLAIYSCAFITIYLIPLADVRLLHASLIQQRGITDALGHGIAMGLGFTIFRIARLPKNAAANTQ